jgi:hypothetical protein
MSDRVGKIIDAIRLPWWLRRVLGIRYPSDGEAAGRILHAMLNPPTGLDSPPYIHVLTHPDEPASEDFDG